MSKKTALALILLMFLASGTVFSQSFEVAGGLVLGYGKAVSENEGDYTNPDVGTLGLGLQMGVLERRFALLAEGNLAWVFPQDSMTFMWNGGAILEFYPIVSKEVGAKIGLGVGGGYGSFLEDAWYVRVAIPFIFPGIIVGIDDNYYFFPGFKLGINGEYYFLENGPVFRAGLMVFVRGKGAVDFFRFRNQTVF